MQIKGRNYLIPVGASIESEDEVPYQALDAQAVLDKMESAGNAMNLLILDACRNNPFLRSARSGAQGLAQMDAPVGTLVAFATSPGAVAADGGGRHGLYTLHLLNSIRQPALKVEEVFKQVRAAVRRDSLGRQVPWESTSLEGDFYFHPPGTAMALKNSDTPSARRPPDLPPTQAPAVPAAASAAVSAEEMLLAMAPQRVNFHAGVGPLSQGGSEGDRWGNSGTERRPATPRRNPNGLSEGDRFRYRVVDTAAKVTVVDHYLWRIDRIDDTGLSVNDGRVRLDAMGQPAGSAQGWPPWLVAPAVVLPDLAVGSMHAVKGRRSLRGFLGTSFELDFTGVSQVERQEQVDTPAGRFNAYRVQATLHGDDGWMAEVTVWWSTDMGMWVVMEDLVRRRGEVRERRRHELTAVDSLVLAGK
jgi:hypothetical protein